MYVVLVYTSYIMWTYCSLLLAASIRPEPGNPESGVAMPTHLIEICFLEQSEFSSYYVYSHYQYPLVGSSFFPSLH